MRHHMWNALTGIPATHRWSIDTMFFNGGTNRYQFPDEVTSATSRTLFATVGEGTDVVVSGKHYLENGNGGLFTSPALADTLTKGYLAFLGYNRIDPVTFVGFTTNVATPNNRFVYGGGAVSLYLGSALVASAAVASGLRRAWVAAWDSTNGAGACKVRLFDYTGALVSSSNTSTFTPDQTQTILSGSEWGSQGLAFLQLGNTFPTNGAAGSLARQIQARYA